MWNKLPNDATKLRVARPSVLSASKELLFNYKEGRINWQEFENRFRKEILSNPTAVAELKRLKDSPKRKMCT
jgi:uncharacterized protein YeaO (DUF488 family)